MTETEELLKEYEPFGFLCFMSVGPQTYKELRKCQTTNISNRVRILLNYSKSCSVHIYYSITCLTPLTAITACTTSHQWPELLILVTLYVQRSFRIKQSWSEMCFRTLLDFEALTFPFTRSTVFLKLEKKWCKNIKEWRSNGVILFLLQHDEWTQDIYWLFKTNNFLIHAHLAIKLDFIRLSFQNDSFCKSCVNEDGPESLVDSLFIITAVRFHWAFNLPASPFSTTKATVRASNSLNMCFELLTEELHFLNDDRAAGCFIPKAWPLTSNSSISCSSLSKFLWFH